MRSRPCALVACDRAGLSPGGGLPGLISARAGRPTFTMIPLTGLASRCTPTALPPTTPSLPAFTSAGLMSGAWTESAANNGDIAPADDPSSARFGSLASEDFLTSDRFRPAFGLARTRGRLAVPPPPSHRRGRFRRQRAIPRLSGPNFSGPGASAWPGLPAGTDEASAVAHGAISIVGFA